MGFVRVKVEEFAEDKGWSLKDLAKRSGLKHSKIIAYAHHDKLAYIDYIAIKKMAIALDVDVEDLVEIIED